MYFREPPHLDLEGLLKRHFTMVTFLQGVLYFEVSDIGFRNFLVISMISIFEDFFFLQKFKTSFGGSLMNPVDLERVKVVTV